MLMRSNVSMLELLRSTANNPKNSCAQPPGCLDPYVNTQLSALECLRQNIGSKKFAIFALWFFNRYYGLGSIIRVFGPLKKLEHNLPWWWWDSAVKSWMSALNLARISRRRPKVRPVCQTQLHRCPGPKNATWFCCCWRKLCQIKVLRPFKNYSA